MVEVAIFEGGRDLHEDSRFDEVAGPVEIIHWFDEPTDWITEEYTGVDPKDYWHKWSERNHDLDKQLELINEHLREGDVNYKIFKWQMRDIKDTVLIMRAISVLVETRIRDMKIRKIVGAPQDKFYARCSTCAGAVAFITGIISSALDLISVDSVPSWTSLLLFLLTAGFTWFSAYLAERWGDRERKIRKMQRITERKGIIDHAKCLIDILDFDERMLKKIATRESTPQYKRLSRKLSASDRNEMEIVRDLRRKDALLRDLPPELRRRITPGVLRDELERRKALRHGLQTEISQNHIDSHLQALKRSTSHRKRKAPKVKNISDESSEY